MNGEKQQEAKIPNILRKGLGLRLEKARRNCHSMPAEGPKRLLCFRSPKICTCYDIFDIYEI